MDTPLRRRGQIVRQCVVCLWALAALVALTAWPQAALAATPTPLGTLNDYPRVIRLQYSGSANGRLLATAGGGSTIYQSTDEGAQWQAIGTVGGTSGCCVTLFEFPQQLGNYAAGTLLLARIPAADTASFGKTIDVYRSTDHGASWSFHSQCATGGQGNVRGLWEPEFTVDAYGRLLCIFADERQSGYSQVLGQVVSTDGGLTWGNYSIAVGIQDNDQRPGMPIVRKLPNGTYIMAYEACGSQGSCRIYTRTSSDGANWGTATNLGNLVQSGRGTTFTCCPGLAWSPGGGPNGRLLVIGRYVNGGSSGSVVMSTTDITGVSGWEEVPAPFVTPNPNSDSTSWHCENYSSALLPSVDGSRLLMVAGMIVNGSCQTVVGSDISWLGVNDSTTGSANNQIAYTSAWQAGSGCSDCYGGNDHFTDTANATATISFYGTQLKLYGAKAPWHGLAAISIDGGSETTVDCYASSRQGQQLLYTSPTLSTGQHTVQIRATGTHTSSATGNWISVDNIEIAPVATVINDTVSGTGNNQIEYTGTWAYGNSCDECFSRDDHYSSTANTTAKIRFTGTHATVYAARAPWHGIVAFAVDGGSETLVDCYNAVRQGQVIVYNTPTLAAGQHTLTVRVTGTQSSSATGAWVTIDRVNVN